jgi:hypothetical protein
LCQNCKKKFGVKIANILGVKIVNIFGVKIANILAKVFSKMDRLLHQIRSLAVKFALALFKMSVGRPGLPDFSLTEHTKTGKIYQITTNQTTINYAKWTYVKYSKYSKIYQHFPFQGLPKFTQIEIFGTNINHLATLV